MDAKRWFNFERSMAFRSSRRRNERPVPVIGFTENPEMVVYNACNLQCYSNWMTDGFQP